MKRKLIMKIIRISGVCILLCLVAVSMWTAHLVNSRKNLEPPLVHAGSLPDLQTSEKQLLKHQVCPKFPIKLSSEIIEETINEIQTMCLVTYKGHRLAISDSNEVMMSLVGVFKKTHLKNAYSEMSTRELVSVVYELPVPEHRWFYYRPKHFNDAMIYMLRSLERALNKSESFKKYDHPKFNIYAWDRPSPELPKDQVVMIFSDTLALTCRGDFCFEYLRAIEVI